MPKEGAIPQRSPVTRSRPGASPLKPIRFSRRAATPPNGWFRSAVTRPWGPLPAVPLTSWTGVSFGVLLTWLMMPPVDPRPNRTEEGPFSTSTDSRLKVSRAYWPRSRTPSI